MKKLNLKTFLFLLLAVLLLVHSYLVMQDIKQKIIYNNKLERKKELLIEQNFLLDLLIEKLEKNEKLKQEQKSKEIDYNLLDYTIREVSAYNVGDINQCWGDPCISANQENICEALELGYKRCASNFVPFGTKLYIENYGECLVVDRMNSRYKNRVDIAMKLSEKQKAINFGIQKLKVKIIK